MSRGGCTTWDGWAARSAAENRQLRTNLWQRGQYDGYLLYVDGEIAGWCQVGPRDRLDKLTQQVSLAPDPAAWAITCFMIAPAHRGQGHAAWLLDHVLSDLKAQGVTIVETFPRRGDDLEVDDPVERPGANVSGTRV